MEQRRNSMEAMDLSTTPQDNLTLLCNVASATIHQVRPDIVVSQQVAETKATPLTSSPCVVTFPYIVNSKPPAIATASVPAPQQGYMLNIPAVPYTGQQHIFAQAQPQTNHLQAQQAVNVVQAQQTVNVVQAQQPLNFVQAQQTVNVVQAQPTVNVVQAQQPLNFVQQRPPPPPLDVEGSQNSVGKRFQYYQQIENPPTISSLNHMMLGVSSTPTLHQRFPRARSPTKPRAFVPATPHIRQRMAQSSTSVVNWGPRLVRPPAAPRPAETGGFNVTGTPNVRLAAPLKVYGAPTPVSRASVIRPNPYSTQTMQTNTPQTTITAPIFHCAQKLTNILRAPLILTTPPETPLTPPTLPVVSLPSFRDTFAHPQEQFSSCGQEAQGQSKEIEKTTTPSPPKKKSPRKPRNSKIITPPSVPILKKPKAPRSRKKKAVDLAFVKQTIDSMAKSAGAVFNQMTFPSPCKMVPVSSSSPAGAALPSLEDTKITVIKTESEDVAQQSPELTSSSPFKAPIWLKPEDLPVAAAPAAAAVGIKPQKRRSSSRGRGGKRDGMPNKRRKTEMDLEDKEEELEVLPKKTTARRKCTVKQHLSLKDEPPARKWVPNAEEKKVLYKELSYLVESSQAGKPPLETILWRIFEEDGKILLRKYEPLDLSGRELHRATDQFLMFDTMDKVFYSRYQPVYTLQIIDSPKVSVCQYLNVDRITPNFLRIQGTETLFPHYKLVVEMIFREVMVGEDFLKGKVTDSSTNFEAGCKKAWDVIDMELKDRAKTLCESYQLPAEFIRPFCKFPVIKFPRFDGQQKRTYCGACSERSTKKSAAFLAEFRNEPYDPHSFEELPLPPEGVPKDRYLCLACKPLMTLMMKLLHYKWHIYLVIRGYLSNLIRELDPGEQLDPLETIKTLVDDYEWMIKAFVDFQVVLAEADREIERLTKPTS